MQVYYDHDVDLHVLDNQTIAIIGYGNQGRAQGMNMRDSGLKVIVGNVEDDSFKQAVADGFQTMSIQEAARQADVLCIFIPDEVQSEVYQKEIFPVLRAGQALNFAHGYTIRYGLIQPPQFVDVIMVAPRMIGVGVRERFLAGTGAPVFVAVQQDATGHAWATTLAIAKGIGATRRRGAAFQLCRRDRARSLCRTGRLADHYPAVPHGLRSADRARLSA